MKHVGVFSPFDINLLRQKLYNIYADEPYILFLDSNNYKEKPYTSFDFLFAVGKETIKFGNNDHFNTLKHAYNQHEWLLGYIGYDLKNEIEDLQSTNPDYINFPEIIFFIPTLIIRQENKQLIIESSSEIPENVFDTINSYKISASKKLIINRSSVLCRISKEQYIKNVERIKQDIKEGIYYELNYCQEFYIEQLNIEPFDCYERMNALSQMPFAAFMKLKEQYISCCSPERFLRKQNARLISQPIKGTAPRDTLDSQHDDVLKQNLLSSEKERAENVMIVDLVRNDLTRSAITGSIQVEELCECYTFNSVHQLISTVTAELRSEVHPIDALKAAFPMGSMTGAPKIEVMKHIEKLESTKRNVYSGCLGYITPSGDFDFNVIIRTLCYDRTTQYASYHAGSAITYDSDPEKEYDECRLKAKILFSIIKDEQ